MAFEAEIGRTIVPINSGTALHATETWFVHLHKREIDWQREKNRVRSYNRSRALQATVNFTGSCPNERNFAYTKPDADL